MAIRGLSTLVDAHYMAMLSALGVVKKERYTFLALNVDKLSLRQNATDKQHSVDVREYLVGLR